MVTCAVISAILQPFEAIDEEVHDFPPGLGCQVVQVGENSTHFGGSCASGEERLTDKVVPHKCLNSEAHWGKAGQKMF